MSRSSGSMPTVYLSEEEMLNGNGTSGNGSGQVVPTIVQPDRVEERWTLVPQQAFGDSSRDTHIAHLAIRWISHFCPCPTISLACSRCRDMAMIDHDARKHIILFVVLLDHFSHQM